MSPAARDKSEFAALSSVIEALEGLEPEARQRIFATAATFFNVDSATKIQRLPLTTASPSDSDRQNTLQYPAFSTDEVPTPKDFVQQKEPQTDVERIAVLAYYLTHYRNTPHFKTLDLSALNTEAAMPKLANAANAASNAQKMRYLVPGTKGMRQLSAPGERFVEALPDRDLARAEMAKSRPRRVAKKSSGSTRAKP
jgi:hypothetical protein